LLVNAGEAAIARDTLTRRGLIPPTWETWQLGYALDSWDALTNRLVAKGYALEELEAAGLVVRRDDGSGCYDRFRGRLMIPIRDARGRAIGFGARVLREDPAHLQPKYINSPQTPLFDKSAVLFGLDMARKAIRDAGLAVIVEGYMDVLMAHQAGFTNVVAGMGTALTEEQLRQLKRYTANVTLALDPDAAGDHAVLRGLETARQVLDREWQPVMGPRGLVRQASRLKAQVRIAALPDGLDPDELIQRDPERWRQVLAGAKPIVDYYLGVVGREEDLSSARGKANIVERIAPLIREITNEIERKHYIQLLGRLIQAADERVLEEQVDAVGRAPEPLLDTVTPTGKTVVGSPQAAVSSSGLEEHLLGHLLAWPELLARLDADLSGQNTPPLSEEDFTRGENRTILAALQTSLDAAEDWSLDHVLDGLPTALHALCQALAERARQSPALTDDKLVKDAGDSLLRLRARNLSQRVGQLQFLIRDSEEAGAREQLREYHELMTLYTAQKRHIQKLLDARTMIGALRL
jgi:DNA primase